MPSITIKDIPPDVHAQLRREADANFRSLNQEALARLARSLEEERSTTARDQKWVDEAYASGDPAPFRSSDLEKIRAKILGPRKRR